MTSVPNRPLPLSGNSAARLCLLLVLLSVFTACDLFKKAPRDDGKVYDDSGELEEIKGKVVYNPQTGEYETVYEPRGDMDTVRLAEIPTDRVPPIRSDIDPDDLPTPDLEDLQPVPGVKKERYQIAMVLPFLSNQFNGASLPNNSDWAVGFYAGAQLALDQLEAEGVKATVVTADTEAQAGTLRGLLTQPVFANADLIIGPYLSNNVKVAADAVRGKQQVLVSPYSANLGLSANNPNYVQVNPSLIVHINAQLNHARATHRAEQIQLVGAPGGDAARLFPYYQAANAAFDGGNAEAPLGVLEIGPDERTGWDEINLIDALDSLSTNVLILPEYRDQRYVYNFLRKLKIASRNPLRPRDVIVYGMPQWQEFNRVEYDLYEDLNVHISSSHYVDRDRQAVRAFRTAYYDRFGIAPPESAYLGYDTALYFGRLLKKYGTGFPGQLEREADDLLHTRYDFERVLPAGATTAEGPAAPVQQWENKFVHILAFRGYQFQPAR